MFARQVRACWSAATATTWTRDNPAAGQCGVTALLAQEELGGQLLRMSVAGAAHFYNRIGGKPVDFTSEQFGRTIEYEDRPATRADALADCTAAQLATMRRAWAVVIDRARIRDADRPSALAHDRFAMAQGALDALPLPSLFGRIHSQNLWGARQSVSDNGSEAAATERSRRLLPDKLATPEARTLLDAPCGDGAWIDPSRLGVTHYTGIDIVPALIDRLRGAERQGVAYQVADITRDHLPHADAVLCRDRLVHLDFATVAAAIATIRRSGATWLLTTSFPALARNVDCRNGDWRALNLMLPPFDWPEPAMLVNEGSTETGGGWRDKSLAAWRIADLPS